MNVNIHKRLQKIGKELAEVASTQAERIRFGKEIKKDVKKMSDKELKQELETELVNFDGGDWMSNVIIENVEKELKKRSIPYNVKYNHVVWY